MCTLKPNHERNTRRPLLFGDDFLRIFLPIIDDEEQRRLEELEEDEEETFKIITDKRDQR